MAVATAEQPPQDWPARARPGGAAAGLSGRRWWRWRQGTRAHGRGTRPRGARAGSRPSPLLPLAIGWRPPPPARSRGSVSSLRPLHPAPPPNSTLGEPAARSKARAHTRTFQTSLLFWDPGVGDPGELGVLATGGRALGPLGPAARDPAPYFPLPLQAQELTPCQDCARTLWKRLLPTPSPGFLCSARPEPEAPKLLVSAALLLCDCSQEKGGLFAASASVRLRRAGDAPGLMRL